MPKRKAPEPSSVNAASAAVSGGGGGAISPNPRKKSKKEQLAAAKEWHDKRKSGMGAKKVDAPAAQPVSTSAPSAKKVAARAAASVGTTVPDPVPSKSSHVLGVGEAKSGKSKRVGNAFLQSLRKEKGTSSASAEVEAVPTDSLNGRPSASSSVNENGQIHPLNSPASTQKTTKTKGMGKPTFIVFVEAILVLIFLALSVMMAMHIYDQQIRNNNLYEEYTKEVEMLKADLSKSREVEALLKSGIDVLEEAQMKTERAVDDLNQVFASYNGPEESSNLDLQSREEKAEWLERLRLLEVEKNLGLDNFDDKLRELGIEGGKGR